MDTILHISNLKLKNNIFYKRDDLLPFSFGGNKVRIANEFFADMKKHQKNCIIGYGSTKSNLCRVLANKACIENIPCYIITKHESDEYSSNAQLVKDFGAKIFDCSSTNVAETINNALLDARSKGYDPYYIYGDVHGNGNEKVPVNAYVKCFNEIVRQGKEQNLSFDYIFCASGTGMTQAGLIAGKLINNKDVEIIGISIAREKEQAVRHVKKYLSAYLSSEYTDFDKDIHLVDEYICGGYGKYDDRILDTIKMVCKSDGVALDPCYTGKAFCGMLQYLERNGIENKNILFLHTGGQPLFFDMLKKVGESK